MGHESAILDTNLRPDQKSQNRSDNIFLNAFSFPSLLTSMPFGSLSLSYAKYPFTTYQLPPTSIEIRGKQYGAINNSVVIFKYLQNQAAPVNGFFHLPVDNDICVHTVTFSCEGRELTLVSRESGDARGIVKSAEQERQLFAIINKPEDRVAKVELGLLPPGAEIILTVNMTLVAASSSATSIFFKFPLESCSPSGLVVTLGDADFLFEQEIHAAQPIASVSSNLGGTWSPRDGSSGVFRLITPSLGGSVIVTTTFVGPIGHSAAQFGDVVAAFVVPEDAGADSPPQEYVFVLDCSGSMSGGRIDRAKECLKLYLHSLPPNGFFNIVRFGSSAKPMWPGSLAITDANVGAALAYTDGITADLGGTEMSHPLQWIFDSDPVFPDRQRQLFILTDGQDFYPDRVMSLVTANRSAIRCFTIGFGHGADPGIVKGIANRTNGRYDFVYDGVDLRSKVIPQLAAALAPSVGNVTAEISGAVDQRVVQHPIQPLIPGNLATIFIQCQGVDPGAQVLVSGSQEGRPVDCVAPIGSICQDADFNAAVSKFVALVQLVQLEQIINGQREGSQTQQSLIREAIAISVRSGILCPWTALVGVQTQSAPQRERPRVFVSVRHPHEYVCVELDRSDPAPTQTILNAVAAAMNRDVRDVSIEFPGTDFAAFADCQILTRQPVPGEQIALQVKSLTGKIYDLVMGPAETVGDLKVTITEITGIPEDQQRLVFRGRQLDDESATLSDMQIVDNATVHLVLRLRGGASVEEIAEVEPRQKQNDVSSVLAGHSVEGCWLNADEMRQMAGITVTPALPVVPPEEAAKVLATVLALAILRKRCSDQQELWRLLEVKALKWLARVKEGVDWSTIVDAIARDVREN
jgi:hypothetical protein